MRPIVDRDSGMTTCAACGEDLQLSPHAVYEHDPPICEGCAEEEDN
jgi:formylmethanofuran dehydrogenase subunit E